MFTSASQLLFTSNIRISDQTTFGSIVVIDQLSIYHYIVGAIYIGRLLTTFQRLVFIL